MVAATSLPRHRNFGTVTLLRATRTRLMTTRKPLDRYRRIVIKIGSALLVDRKSGLKKAWLDAMCADIAALKKKGVDVLVVSSGAIALGRSVLDLASGALKLEE